MLWITLSKSPNIQTTPVKSDAIPLKGLFVVKKASEYRAMAEECFGWAQEAHTKEVRDSYEQLAQVWLNAASFIDGGPPIRTAPPARPTNAA
jgi:hypothetical protein